MGTRILGLRLPGWRLLLLAFGFVVAAGVATPLLAQSVTVDTWVIGATVRDIDVDTTALPNDVVWANVNGGLRKLDPATNLLTTYTHPGGGGSVITVDGGGKPWLPGVIQPITGPVYVLTRLDPATLQVTSWPWGEGVFANSMIADTSGNIWAARNSSTLKRLDPATDTVTTWIMPVTVSVWDTDSLERVWLYWDDGTDRGPAAFDPASNNLTYWVAATSPDNLYPPFVDGTDQVWFPKLNNTGEDGIGRLNPATNEITEWVCPPGCDGLTRVSVDAAGDVWFTEDGACGSLACNSYIGRLNPAADPPVWTRWALTCDNVNAASCGGPSIVKTSPRSLRLDSSENAWAYFVALGTVSDDIARLTPP